MTANERALTKPKFELGITVIIQNVFQGVYTTKQKKWKIVGKKLIIFHGGGGVYPSMENSMKIINIIMQIWDKIVRVGTECKML